MRIRLAGETDFEGFRDKARDLLARAVPPEAVSWDTGGNQPDLFAVEEPMPVFGTGAAMRLSVPAGFLESARFAALHAQSTRFSLLYRLLWRLAREPTLRHDPLDADMMQLRQLAQAVRREIHKMRAFVRFRQVDADGERVHVAWFEPEHHIVEANAPWFMRRFAQMRWAILTPLRSVAWDGENLRFEAGAQRADAPAADDGEALWLAYYASIFNPARLKLNTMRGEMPRRYWKNLPEAELIAPLAAAAAERTGRMIEREAGAAARGLPVVQPPTAPIVTQIHSLDDLHAAVRQCGDCAMASRATQAVPGEGRPGAPIMLVGEQPGDQEDLAGRPFVGPAGQLLDRAMSEAEVKIEDVYRTNAVRHFTYELRGRRRIHKTPAKREVQACARWLSHEIELVQPRVLVALGATAARALLGRPVSIRAERGKWHANAQGLQVLVTWHPSALLRMERAERDQALGSFVSDLQEAARAAFSIEVRAPISTPG